ncbi:MAG: DUF721 domain-containing protein [Fibrobacter sp.]|nr:DUF721 domain-containing protein [Fibrobacter sp.]
MSIWNSPEKIESIVDNILCERGYQTICKEYEVVSKWNEVVGEKISEISVCDRVEDGVLYVKVSSSSWRNELIYLKNKIINQIKKETECTTIRDIVFY